jgi:hypothetical protein
VEEVKAHRPLPVKEVAVLRDLLDYRSMTILKFFFFLGYYTAAI